MRKKYYAYLRKSTDTENKLNSRDLASGGKITGNLVYYVP